MDFIDLLDFYYVNVHSVIIFSYCVELDWQNNHTCMGIVPGGAGGAMAPPDFGRLVNPISTRGTDYAHYWHPRIFRPSDGPEYTVGEITTLNATNLFRNKKMSSNTYSRS